MKKIYFLEKKIAQVWAVTLIVDSNISKFACHLSGVLIIGSCFLSEMTYDCQSCHVTVGTVRS